jgi:hypothetical protein
MNENSEATNMVVLQGNDAIEALEATQRAEYDIQIATAKKFPRDLTRCKNNALAIITMDKQIAESCRYALPRGGKSISGPSVHLARILAQQYGNLRLDSRVKMVTATQIKSEAVCFDLETNYAVKVEVIRSITGKNGRYNDDMITVAGNASNAIAFRNAVLSVIPKGLTDICYKKAVEMITGDLSDETKLIQARTKAIDHFVTTYGCTQEDVLDVIGVKTLAAIKPEHIADMRGLVQSLIDGDATPENTFKSLRIDTKDIDKINDQKERTRILKHLDKCDTLEDIELLEGNIPNIADYNITVELDAKKASITAKAKGSK